MSAAKKNVVSSAATIKKVNKEKLRFSLTQIPYRWIHVLMVLFIYVFCTCIYGDLFQRAQQESFVTTNREYMTYILRLPFGEFHWAMRFVMTTVSSRLTSLFVFLTLNSKIIASL